MTDDIFVFLPRIYVISIFYKIRTCTPICVCGILDSSAMILIKIMFLFINNSVVEYRKKNKSILLPLLSLLSSPLPCVLFLLQLTITIGLYIFCIHYWTYWKEKRMLMDDG